MKYLNVLFLVFLGSGCSNMALKYEAYVRTDKGQVKYTFEKSYSMGGWALGCGLTSIFYGGWCWTYLARPFNVDQEIMSIDAKDELRDKYKLSGFEVTSSHVSQVGWHSTPTRSTIVPYEEPQVP